MASGVSYNPTYKGAPYKSIYNWLVIFAHLVVVDETRPRVQPWPQAKLWQLSEPPRLSGSEITSALALKGYALIKLIVAEEDAAQMLEVAKRLDEDQ